MHTPLLSPQLKAAGPMHTIPQFKKRLLLTTLCLTGITVCSTQPSFAITVCSSIVNGAQCTGNPGGTGSSSCGANCDECPGGSLSDEGWIECPAGFWLTAVSFSAANHDIHRRHAKCWNPTTEVILTSTSEGIRCGGIDGPGPCDWSLDQQSAECSAGFVLRGFGITGNNDSLTARDFSCVSPATGAVTGTGYTGTETYVECVNSVAALTHIGFSMKANCTGNGDVSRSKPVCQGPVSPPTGKVFTAGTLDGVPHTTDDCALTPVSVGITGPPGSVSSDGCVPRFYDKQPPGAYTFSYTGVSPVTLLGKSYTFTGITGASQTLTSGGQITATYNFVSQTFLLSVSKGSSTGTGLVTSAPAGISCGSTCSASYASGTPVTLTAAQDTGSTFTSWTGCDSTSGTNGEICHVTMPAAAKTVTVTFTAQTFLLSVNKDGTGAAAGTVTSADGKINCGTTCSASYASGTSVTLTATPASTFSKWVGCDSTSGTSCFVTMTADKPVTARFTAQTFLLTVNKAVGNTGTGTVTSISTPPNATQINCGPTCTTASATYPQGTQVTLTADKATDSTFGGWSGEGCAGTGTCVVTMTQARTVTARFDLIIPGTCVSPTNLSPSGLIRPPDGTVQLSWSHPGPSSYNVRLDDGIGDLRFDDPDFPTCNPNPHYYCENGIPGPPISRRVPVVAGRIYAFWIHPNYSPPRLPGCTGSTSFTVLSPCPAKMPPGQLGRVSAGDPIRASHINDLRTAINQKRADAGLDRCDNPDPNCVWDWGPVVGGQDVIRVKHINNLRTAIFQVYGQCGGWPPAACPGVWSNGDPLASGTPIQAIHINELRCAVEQCCQ